MPWRHETKYTVPLAGAGLAAGRLPLLPQGLREVYPPRWVNSLYFDALTGERYLQTVEGLGQRSKVRARWYGEAWGEISSASLEIKHKAGHAGRKETVALPPFQLSRSTPRRDLRRLPAAAPRIALAERLEPVLLTRYRRGYWATRDGLLRLTLDRDVRYLGIGGLGFAATWRHDPRRVVELKYDVEHRPAAEALAQDLGLRWTRNSKYARGLQATALGTPSRWPVD